MDVHPKFPKFLPAFLRTGYSLGKKINTLYGELITPEKAAQFNAIPGHTTLRQCATLFYYAYTCAKKNNTIVEIGSFKGKSTCWMAYALKLAGADKKIFAIDPHINTKDIGEVPSYDEPSSFEAFLENIKNSNVAQFVEPIKDTSENAAKNWNRKIDFLFIDGSHKYDDVMLDLKLWEPFVVVGGIIAMHDTKPYGGRIEVYKAMNDYIEKSGRFKEQIKLLNMACFQKIKEIGAKM